MPKRRHAHPNSSWSRQDHVEIAEHAERLFLQMRLVRDAARNLIVDIDGFEARLNSLRQVVAQREEPAPTPPTPIPTSTPQRILRLREVKVRIGVSHSTIYRLINGGDFPQPVRLGPNSVGWRVEEIEAWLTSRATGT